MPEPTPLIDASEQLHARVRAFIASSLDGAAASEPFDELALALARFQVAHLPALARLTSARGVRLEAALSAAEIAAVPTDVFRLARLAVHPPELDRAVFRTSGTSQGAQQRGEHALRVTETYAAAALAWGRAMLFPDAARLRPILLAPPPSEAPDSSLGFMMELFARELGGGGSWHLQGGAVDVSGVQRACAEARRSQQPALVLGTSFAFVHLLDAAGARELGLPAGSRVMQTGGFKGRSREVAAPELRRAIAGAFGVPERHVVAEYGMTELSSQLYEGTLARPDEAEHGEYLAPPWMRVVAVDPSSLAPLPDGELGLARFVDLANVDSSVALQTADRVRVSPSRGVESCRVELLGRSPGAPPRGCSIATDELLG